MRVQMVQSAFREDATGAGPGVRPLPRLSVLHPPLFSAAAVERKHNQIVTNVTGNIQPLIDYDW